MIKTTQLISLTLYCMSMAVYAHQTPILNEQTQSALELFGAMEQIIKLQETIDSESIDQATIDSNRLKSDFINLLTSYLTQFGACHMSGLLSFYISSIDDKHKPLTPELYESFLAILKQAEYTADWAETIHVELDFINPYSIKLTRSCNLRDIMTYIKKVPLHHNYQSTILKTAAAVAAISAGALAIYSIYQNKHQSNHIVPTDDTVVTLAPNLTPVTPVPSTTNTSTPDQLDDQSTTNTTTSTVPVPEIEQSFFDKSWQEKTGLEQVGTVVGGAMMAAPLLHPAVRQAGKNIATEGTTKLLEKLAGNVGDVAGKAMTDSMHNQAKFFSSNGQAQIRDLPIPPVSGPIPPASKTNNALMIRQKGELTHGNNHGVQEVATHELNVNNHGVQEAAIHELKGGKPITQKEYKEMLQKRIDGNQPNFTNQGGSTI